ncbi:MAG: hypothetical protein IJ061_02225 [Lachnospiraceae bacterium]|nr:hypothetical protein [Lachnospiraceae bacterium]
MKMNTNSEKAFTLKKRSIGLTAAAIAMTFSISAFAAQGLPGAGNPDHSGIGYHTEMNNDTGRSQDSRSQMHEQPQTQKQDRMPSMGQKDGNQQFNRSGRDQGQNQMPPMMDHQNGNQQFNNSGRDQGQNRGPLGMNNGRDSMEGIKEKIDALTDPSVKKNLETLNQKLEEAIAAEEAARKALNDALKDAGIENTVREERAKANNT